MSGRLSGKVALVPGAASGIDAAIARLFARKGAQVVGLDRQPSPIGDDGVVHTLVDITDRAAVDAAVLAALAAHGGIDVLVNNAGADLFADPLALSDDDWERCLSVNLNATDILIDGGRSQVCHD
ncbi:SDR family NAD(P)-dependent oxidoreductase [Marilutibacter alkalisoli]|uniref:SDR family NAD(P)-dependent oxidoreductase n=1 Tax=Marilutibacter alkalisoli TaxID=2591633 RepID=A0A514BW67_9GAMM|nr:SDR family NAD(P)-dependent oxidoreductase [Lysobacter alkalisoli]QDH71249.1 SDR family NAD(P)-dependent oxidoreductase [Lysobacter alkalisoli]